MNASRQDYTGWKYVEEPVKKQISRTLHERGISTIPNQMTIFDVLEEE